VNDEKKKKNIFYEHVHGKKWTIEIIENVTTAFYEQIKMLIETMKQMQTSLQRRSKLQQNTLTSSKVVLNNNINNNNNNNNNNVVVSLTDTEKISLQVFLDVEAFAKEIFEKFGVDAVSLNSYVLLKNEIVMQQQQQL
jgi:hypothetical protein